MPESPVIFRQKRDERYWSDQVKDRDKADLDPYIRWISANEEDENRQTAGSSEDWERLFSVLYLPAKGRVDYSSINETIQACKVPYIILCVGDIRFSPGAFFAFSEAAEREPGPDFIYSDEDLIDENGVRSNPFFKPGWSPDTLMSFLYTGRAGVFRTGLLKELGGLRAEYGEAAYYDLVLRFIEKAKRICHISKVLYHADVFAENKNASIGGLVRVKEDALRRRKLAGTVTWNERAEEAEVAYSIQGEPLVSIIILSKDHYEMPVCMPVFYPRAYGI